MSALLLVSWLPNILQHLLPLYGARWRHFRRAVMYLYFFNTAGNPILYTLVNRDFKNYAKRQIVLFISKDYNLSEGNQRNRTYTARLSPLSVGSSSYARPVKSAVLQIAHFQGQSQSSFELPKMNLSVIMITVFCAKSSCLL